MLWILGCLAVATAAAGVGWASAWADARRWRETAERLRITAAELFAQRNLAQAQLVDLRDDVASMLATIARLTTERDEARGQLAMTLRRDPTTGRFLRNGGLQHPNDAMH